MVAAWGVRGFVEGGDVRVFFLVAGWLKEVYRRFRCDVVVEVESVKSVAARVWCWRFGDQWKWKRRSWSWGESDYEDKRIHQSWANLLLLVNIPSTVTGCPVSPSGLRDAGDLGTYKGASLVSWPRPWRTKPRRFPLLVHLDKAIVIKLVINLMKSIQILSVLAATDFGYLEIHPEHGQDVVGYSLQSILAPLPPPVGPSSIISRELAFRIIMTQQ